MDGLLLTGGKDINPIIMGIDLEWNGARKCNLTRDLFERDLMNAFLAQNKPVFGICRGFQLITALIAPKEAGFSMQQDINKHKDVTLMHQQGEVDIPGDNPVHIIETRGVMKHLCGEFFPVNSFHHQGFFMNTGKTMDEAWIRQSEDVLWWARSRETAKILEAFGMLKNEVKIGGVQYHPERMMTRANREKHLALFQYTMGTLEFDFVPEIPPLPTYRTHSHTPSTQSTPRTWPGGV
jgi:gamma-glutamyl-gamma-aminobutyrate hydrolase PuuD